MIHINTKKKKNAYLIVSSTGNHKPKTLLLPDWLILSFPNQSPTMLRFLTFWYYGLVREKRCESKVPRTSIQHNGPEKREEKVNIPKIVFGDAAKLCKFLAKTPMKATSSEKILSQEKNPEQVTHFFKLITFVTEQPSLYPHIMYISSTMTCRKCLKQ